MSTLIPDLENLSNEYLDPISYLNLIAEIPKVFNKTTYKKILKNFESTFPLQFFTETWNKTLEMKADFEKSQIKIDPKYLCSLIIKYAQITSSGGIEAVDDWNDLIYNEIESTRREYNNLFDSDYTEILAYIEDLKLVDEIENLNVENQKDLLLEARKILIETDPDVYDTTEPFGTEYTNKMTPILRYLLEKKYKKSPKVKSPRRSPAHLT